MVSTRCISFSFFLILTVTLVLAKPGYGPGDQDWGFVQVRPNAEIFWWLYGSTNSTNKPLFIWLQGGPAASSSGEGNILMSGPTDQYNHARDFSLVQLGNVLYIDSPVGAGYSYVDTTKGGTFATSFPEAANDLIHLLRGFLKVHPEYEKVPLYIIGESFGGKMAPAFAARIHEEIVKGNWEVNLKGVAMAYPAAELLSTIGNMPETLFNAGIIDVPGKKDLDVKVLAIFDSAFGHRWEEAALRHDELISYVRFTYGIDFFRFTEKRGQFQATDFDLNYFMDNKVSPLLNITRKFATQREAARSAMIDKLQSVIPQVSYLLDRSDVKITIFSGQLDWVINSKGTYSWVKDLYWHGKTGFNKAPRKPFYIENIHEGHYREYDQLSFYWIKRAGHQLPNDNPGATKFILQRLLEN